VNTPPRLPDEVVGLQLDAYRERYEAGHKRSLLDAVSFCAQYGVVMPLWVADGFVRGHTNWMSKRVKTLDAAFEVTWPKGKQFEAAKRKHDLGFIVYHRVKQLHDAGAVLDVTLFERVAKEEHTNRDFVAKQYYAWKKTEISPD